MDHSAELVSAVYVETGELFGIGDRFGGRAQWRRLVHRLMGPVSVVMDFELAKGVPQVVLVPDQSAVQEFVAAGGLVEGQGISRPDPG